jgi:hypothetical protein
MPTRLTPADRTTFQDALCADPSFAQTARERYQIVRNALDGYPDLEKALRFVTWDGNVFVVSGELLQRLDGLEAAPTVPALALLSHVIEGMAVSPHREKMADLRRRNGWVRGGQPAAVPPSDWRDTRAEPELRKERIIGENTLRHMYYLRRALAAAEAVVRVDVYGQKTGTGFLVAPDLMMTNHHVIASPEQATNARAWFFDELPDEQHGFRQPLRSPVFAAAASLLYTNVALDFTLVRLKDCPEIHRCLPLRPTTVQQNSRVAIIQHPEGGPKKISLQNNMVAYASQHIVQYYTSTMPGSSGSPVFDDDFAVVAIHHSSVSVNPSSNPGDDRQYRNQGASMVALLEDVKKNAPALAAEFTLV